MRKKKRVNYKKATVVLSVAGVLLGSVFLFEEESGVPANPASPLVYQYSEKNITENAIIKDPKFEHIAFAPSTGETNFYADQFASVFRAFKWIFEEKENVKEEYGTWLWTPTLQMSDKYIETILTDIKSHNINVVYLSIDSYLDIYVMPEGPLKEEKQKQFESILDKFIRGANQRGIAVDAEAGWKNWAEDGHQYKAYAVLDFAKKYNASHEYKFRGFQYDVEPYLLDEYKEDKASVLKNFVELIDLATNFLKDSDLKFSVVIPEFYDKKDEATPEFYYKGRKASAYKHLLYILEEKEGGSIIIMSYRNFANGEDGSVEVSKNEMKTAKNGRFSTNIIIAQEVGDVPPPYITFHNTSHSYFLEEKDKIVKSFDSYKNFGGIAVHYANAFVALKRK